MVKKDVEFLNSRMENLRHATIVNYLDEIDVDSDFGLYDKMMEHFYQGDFDDIFDSLCFKNMSENEKKDLLQKVHQFQAVSFYDGNSHYWSDSIEGVGLEDLDFLCMRLLNHFDFLLELAKSGGDSLGQLLAFQEEGFSNKHSVVDVLRNLFLNDEVLISVLGRLSQKDGEYSDLDDSLKYILCTYPQGVLYEEDGDQIRLIPASELIRKIVDYYFGRDMKEYCSLSAINQFFSSHPEVFEEVISDISFGLDFPIPFEEDSQKKH